MPRIPFRSFGKPLRIRPKADPVDLFGNPVHMPEPSPTPRMDRPTNLRMPDARIDPEGFGQPRGASPIEELLAKFDVKHQAVTTPDKYGQVRDLGPDPIATIQQLIHQDTAMEARARIPKPPPKVLVSEGGRISKMRPDPVVRSAYRPTTPAQAQSDFNARRPDEIDQITRIVGDHPEIEDFSHRASDVVDPVFSEDIPPEAFAAGDRIEEFLRSNVESPKFPRKETPGLPYFGIIDRLKGDQKPQALNIGPAEDVDILHKTFNRAYAPGEIEKMLTTGMDPTEAGETVSKIGSLATRMPRESFIKLMQDAAEGGIQPDRTGFGILDEALSLTGPNDGPSRKAVGSASLPIEVLDQPRASAPQPRRRRILDELTETSESVGDPLSRRTALLDEIRSPETGWGREAQSRQRAFEEAKRGTSDVTKRIKRQWVGTPRTESPHSLRDDIGNPVKMTPWGEHKLSFAENPMGREVGVNVGETVEVAGSPLRGKILAITGGPKKIDTELTKMAARGQGDQKNWAGSADDLDFSNPDLYTTTQINSKIGFHKDAKPYLQRKQALKPQVARVEMADGSVRSVQLSRLKRVSATQSVDDPNLRAELADIRRLLAQPGVDGSDLVQRSAKLPPDIAPITRGGVSAGNPAGSKKPFFGLGRDYPTAGGNYRVRHQDFKENPVEREGIPKGEFDDMGIDEALRKGIIKEKPKARRTNQVILDDATVKKVGKSAPLAKHGTIDGAEGGRWKEPPEIGSVHRIVDKGKHILVQVDEVLPTPNQKISVKWTPKYQLAGKNWVKYVAPGALALGGLLASEDDAEAARIPINPKMKLDITAGAAPTISVPNLPRKYATARAIYDTFFPAVEGSRKLEKTKTVVDPENAPHNVLPLNIRGGQAAQEAYTTQIQQDLQAIHKDTDLRNAFEASTRYKSYQNALNIAKDKARMARAQAADLYAKGEDDQADAQIARAMGFEDRLKNKKVVPSGYDDAMIAQELATLESHMTPQEKQAVATAQKGMYAITRKLLKESLDEGLISQEQFTFYAGRGDSYLPMYRLSELFDPESGALIKKQYLDTQDMRANNARVSLLDEDVIDQELMGSDKPTIHPIVGLVKYIDGLTGEIQRNKAAKATLRFYEQYQPQIEQMIPSAPEMAMYRMKKLGNEKPTGDPPEGQAFVGFMDKGLPVYYTVDKDLATTLTYVEPEILRGAPALTKQARALAHMFTASANPAFMATQVPMDVISALIKPNYTKYDKSAFIMDVPGFLGRLSKEVLANYVQKWSGGKVNPQGLRNQTYAAEPQRAMASSGSVNTYLDPKTKVLGFFRGVLSQEQGIARKLMRSVIEAGSQVQDKLLEPLEKGIKNTTYDTLRNRGFGANEAGADTRTMGGSPDFQRYGTLTQRYKNDILFLNPAVQGLASMIESGNRNPAQWAKTATISGIAMAAVAAHNSGFVDDQGRPEIDKVPMADRQNNLIWFHGEPELQSNGDLRVPYIKIPMPHELRTLMSPVMAVLNHIQDPQYSPGQGVLDIASNVIPIGQGKLDASSPGEFVGSVGRKFAGSLNPLYRYPLEVGTGTEFFSNTPIVGSRVAGNMPEYQSTMRTPPGSVAAGKALGVSPDRLNHLLKTVAPGLGEMALEGVGLLTNATPERLTAPLESPTEQSRNAPITGMVNRRFNGALTTNADLSRKKNQFFDFAEAAGQAARTIGSQSNRNPWELQNIPDHVKIMAGVNPSIVELRNALSEIDQAREIITRSPDFSPEEKHARLRELFQTEERIIAGSQTIIAKIQSQLGR